MRRRSPLTDGLVMVGSAALGVAYLATQRRLDARGWLVTALVAAASGVACHAGIRWVDRHGRDHSVSVPVFLVAGLALALGRLLSRLPFFDLLFAWAIGASLALAVAILREPRPGPDAPGPGTRRRPPSHRA